MKGVISDFETFISTFGAGMPKERLSYGAVAPEVLTAVRDRNNSLLQQTGEAAKLAKDLDTTKTKEAERADVAVKAHQNADKLLNEEKTKYDSDRKSLEDKQSAQLATFSTEISKKKAELDKAKQEEDKLNKEVKKREVVITDQATTIQTLRDEPFEVPDGQITWANQAAKTVWINLGLADGLRRQTLFSVYDQADNGVTRTARKASVEVTRVIDQHLAEARIITDLAANPILPGDQIFSPAWRPGKRVRFALAGMMDIDGDRRSDRNLVRSLLAASGGQIDAEMHEDGVIEGVMTSATRYLVLGETPDERSDPKVLSSYSSMNEASAGVGSGNDSCGKTARLGWLSPGSSLGWLGQECRCDSVQAQGPGRKVSNIDRDRVGEIPRTQANGQEGRCKKLCIRQVTAFDKLTALEFVWRCFRAIRRLNCMPLTEWMGWPIHEQLLPDYPQPLWLPRDSVSRHRMRLEGLRSARNPALLDELNCDWVRQTRVHSPLPRSPFTDIPLRWVCGWSYCFGDDRLASPIRSRRFPRREDFQSLVCEMSRGQG